MTDLRKAAEEVLERWDSPAWEWTKQGPTAELMATLRAALAAPEPTHPGYIIGSHWLETAYSRVCASEAEADVLRDYGLMREEAFLTGVAHLKADNERLREALKLALNSHGRMLLTDPPQDSWKVNRVDEVIRELLQEVPR